jgi:hypothetical protein
MTMGWKRRLAAFTVLAAVLAGCGGGGSGPGGDPVGTVKNFLATISAGNYDKVADYACAAQKDAVTKKFDPSAMFGGADALGMSAADIKAAIKMDFSGVTVTEKSKDATKAVVAMAGKMKITLDKDKFKEVIKKALAAAGQPTDDASINLALGMMDSIGGEQDATSDVALANEGGKWLICPTN